jgi:hypothetical protein
MSKTQYHGNRVKGVHTAPELSPDVDMIQVEIHIRSHRQSTRQVHCNLTVMVLQTSERHPLSISSKNAISFQHTLKFPVLHLSYPMPRLTESGWNASLASHDNTIFSVDFTNNAISYVQHDPANTSTQCEHPLSIHPLLPCKISRARRSNSNCGTVDAAVAIPQWDYVCSYWNP